MHVTRLLLAAVLAGGPAIMLAQGPPERQTPAQMAEHEVKRYTALLTLTAPQQEQALAIFTAEAPTTATLRTTEHTDRDALEAAIVADNMATVAQLSTALGELSGKSILARSSAGAASYKLLTPEQQTKLTICTARMRWAGIGVGRRRTSSVSGIAELCRASVC